MYIGTHKHSMLWQFNNNDITLKDYAEYLLKNNGNCIQIFIYKPIVFNYNKNKYIEYETTLINENIYLKQNKMKIVVHSPYNINLWQKLYNNILKVIMNELKICNKLDWIGYVIHVGKYLDLKYDIAKKIFIKNLKKIINLMIENNIDQNILIETPAGQGSEMFLNMSEFNDIINQLTKKEQKYFGICIDTCHIYSSGIDITTIWNLKKYINEFNIKYIKLIHLNNSKTKFNWKIDRHELLDKGTIQYETLLYFGKWALKNNIPVILEHPFDIKEIKKILNF